MTINELMANFSHINGISKYGKNEFNNAIGQNDLADAEHIANTQADNNQKINYHDKQWLKGINGNDYR